MTCAHETADTRALTWCLATLARAAALRKRPNRAAWLWGVAAGLSESIGAPLPTFIRDPTEADLPVVRQALGDERFARPGPKADSRRPTRRSRTRSRNDDGQGFVRAPDVLSCDRSGTPRE